MSNALALAAVTAALCDLLRDGLLDNDWTADAVGDVKVSASPPDSITPGNVAAQSRLNLFLYQLSPNSGWRHVGVPAHDANGGRTGNPPLALDLHYLLTAYGAQDYHAEILLGYAMQRLHVTPVLGRRALRTTFPAGSTVTGPGLTPALRALGTARLDEQVELIKITPHYLGTEEMSKLWTSLQAHYRPSAAYQVSVVLIEEDRPLRQLLPVLTIGPNGAGVRLQPDLAPPDPLLRSIELPGGDPVITLADAPAERTLTLRGAHLAGVTELIFTHRLTTITVPASAGADGAIRVVLPGTPELREGWPAGVYAVQARVVQGSRVSLTNQLPLVLAPDIRDITRVGSGGPDAPLQVTLQPPAWPEQACALTVEARSVPANVHASKTATLTFAAGTVTGGRAYRVRLSVDGIESPLINRRVTPPVFVERVIP